MKGLGRILMLSAMAIVSSLAVSCSGEKDDPVFEVDPVLTLQANPVSYEAGSQFVTVIATGSWTISVSGTDAGWVTVSPTSGSGNVNNVIVTYSENTTEKSRSAYLTLSSATKSFPLHITQTAKQKSDDTGGDSGGMEATGWLELPDFKADDTHAFFYHKMTHNGKKVRNYSFFWDYTNLVSSWVAYPMIGAYANKVVDRTDAWALDPLLPRNKQSVVYTGFDKGNDEWYARGHQLPSADRLFSYEANSQTFYGTNMTPQNNDFNGGIWATLESNVRYWAGKSDTLYVVTGCVIGQSRNYVLDDDGKRVTCPEGYYKVLLRYSSNTTLGYNGYMGCAVYFPDASGNKSASLKSFSMSIDALEEKLGIDFYVNLPAKVGESVAKQIESQTPVSWWWN